MSAILDIYEAIAGLQVTSNGVTPRIRDLGKLTDNEPAMNLPMRILHPFDNRADAQFGFIALGTMADIEWVLTDLCLWAPFGQGLGVRDIAQTLIRYCGDYADAARNLRGPTSQSHIHNISIRPGIEEFPKGSGFRYYTVTCRYSIQEILSG